MSVDSANQRLWFATYVQSLMSNIAGTPVGADSDGDFPAHGATSSAWVSPSASEPWGVRVFAYAAHGVPLRAAVLKEINEINTHDLAVRVAWHPAGSVEVDFLLFADAVTEENLRIVISRVVDVADQIGPMLTAVHGGTTPLPASAFHVDL